MTIDEFPDVILTKVFLGMLRLADTKNLRQKTLRSVEQNSNGVIFF